MEEVRIHVSELFSDLLIVKKKESYHLIAQEILNVLSQIDFFDFERSNDKSYYIKLFDNAEETWEMPYNPNKHFAQQAQDEICKIL